MLFQTFCVISVMYINKVAIQPVLKLVKLDEYLL